MSGLIKLSRMPVFLCTLVVATTLTVACGDRQTMATKSQKAFEEAQKNGTPITKGGHGGHTAMSSEEMSGMRGSATASTSSAGSPGDMKGMDMSGMKQGDMKGMDMSGSKHGDMKGMDMSGSKHGDMKGMDMSGSKHGDMKGMDMSGSKHGDMKGMDMAGLAMGPVIPQPTTIQARPGETAATLQPDPLDSPASSSVRSAQQSSEMNQGGGMPMSMGTYVQRDVGHSSPPSPMKSMNPDMPGMKMGAGTHSMQHGSATSKPSAVTYVCAAHPDIVRDRPGKCPIDGTPLARKEKP
jgi:hypothetical protein